MKMFSKGVTGKFLILGGPLIETSKDYPRESFLFFARKKFIISPIWHYCSVTYTISLIVARMS